MATTSLVVEFLLIGLFPFFTIFFTVLLILGVYDLSFLSQLKDFSSILTVCFILFIYLLGAITHRLSQLVNANSLKFLWKIRSLKSMGKTFSKSEKWTVDYHLVNQFGSDNICEKITYNESLLRVFRSVALSVPIFAIPLSLWLSTTIGFIAALVALIACLVITFQAIIALPIQYKNYREAIEHSARLIRIHQLGKMN